MVGIYRSTGQISLLAVEGESHLAASSFLAVQTLEGEGNELEEEGLGGGKFEEVELLEPHHWLGDCV